MFALRRANRNRREQLSKADFNQRNNNFNHKIVDGYKIDSKCLNEHLPTEEHTESSIPIVLKDLEHAVTNMLDTDPPKEETSPFKLRKLSPKERDDFLLNNEDLI